MEEEIKKADADDGLIHVCAGVRYCEDAIVNGVEESDTEPKMPFMEKSGSDYYDWEWRIAIDPKTGKIQGWPSGVTAKTYYKVCDCFKFKYGDIDYFDYVPAFMDRRGDGFGDYVKVDVDGDGVIANWSESVFRADVGRIREM